MRGVLQRFRAEIETGGAGLVFFVACGALGYCAGQALAVLP